MDEGDAPHSAWSRTEEWSTAVSAKASAEGTVKGIAGSAELSAEAKNSLTESTSGSWSQTRTENTVEKYTQPAKTCSWHWKTTITDSCGTKAPLLPRPSRSLLPCRFFPPPHRLPPQVARSRDFILTDGPARGNAPCCLPGIDKDSNGNCMPNNAGEVVSLC